MLAGAWALRALVHACMRLRPLRHARAFFHVHARACTQLTCAPSGTRVRRWSTQVWPSLHTSTVPKAPGPPPGTRVPPPAETRSTRHRVPGSRAGVYLQARPGSSSGAVGPPSYTGMYTQGALSPGTPATSPASGGGPAPGGSPQQSGGRRWGFGGFWGAGMGEGAAGMGEGTQASQVPPANRVPSGDGRVSPAPRRKELTQSPKGYWGGGVGARSPPGVPAPVLSLGCPHARGCLAALTPMGPGCCHLLSGQPPVNVPSHVPAAR